MYATFERFQIRMTKEQALSGSHPGRCDEDIAELLKIPAIQKQMERISAEDIAFELAEYGAWNEEELSDHDKNKARILWIACGNIRDDLAERS